jgi:DNA topoisomerase I
LEDQLAKNLVIVESPAKAKTLEKYLGKDYTVEASGGHIRDLPPKSFGLKIEKDFTPKYQIIKGKEKIVEKLKAAAKKAKIVYLAPDPDREGEAIAWHLASILRDEDQQKGTKKKKTKKDETEKKEIENKVEIKRIEFNEITKTAVLDAVAHPREIDLKRVDAQQTRRFLDRIVGFKLSPLLWKKIRKGLSAGRVQSVAVRLICEREEEIKKFVPQEYWSIIANLLCDGSDKTFQAKLLQKNGEKFAIPDKTVADAVMADITGKDFTVAKVNKKEQRRNPSAPFITSTLQQESYRKLGYSTKKTMMLAQQLYEGIDLKEEGTTVGLISYMRTDSTRIAKEAQEEVRSMIEKEYGAQYLPKEPRVYKMKKEAQDAHEAIRPTSALRKPSSISESLTPDQLKLYTLIWNRFVSSQMESAVLDQTSADIIVDAYTFRATGSVIKFDGFMAVYLEGKDEESDEDKEGILPELNEGQKLNVSNILPEQHFTQPPARYTEASLVKELEAKGIGRPSTYSPIIGTVQDRGYVEKEGKALKPTELGVTVNEQLVKHFPVILDVEFTAHLEDDLDRILEGSIDMFTVLSEFWKPFEESLKKAETDMEKIKKEVMTEEKCPKCGKNMMIRSGRFGDFMACSGYPECKTTKPLPGSKEAEVVTEKCEKCGKPMVMKRSKFGYFLACSGYPDCKNIKSVLKETGIKCPVDGGNIVEKKTKRGKIFYGCSNYPKCTFALWDKPLAEKCPKCASIMVEKRTKKETKKVCTNEACEYTEIIPL